MHLSATLGVVCVVDVGLVNPNGVAQYKPILVAGYRGEHTAPPLEGRRQRWNRPQIGRRVAPFEAITGPIEVTVESSPQGQGRDPQS